MLQFAAGRGTGALKAADLPCLCLVQRDHPFSGVGTPKIKPAAATQGTEIVYLHKAAPGAVHLDQTTVGIQYFQAIRTVFKNGPQKFFFLAKHVFVGFPVMNVREGAHPVDDGSILPAHSNRPRQMPAIIPVLITQPVLAFVAFASLSAFGPARPNAGDIFRMHESEPVQTEALLRCDARVLLPAGIYHLCVAGCIRDVSHLRHSFG